MSFILSRFSTAGHSAPGNSELHFGNVFVGDTSGGSAIFFVIHPNSWRPYQHRFKTSSISAALKKVASSLTGGLSEHIIGDYLRYIG